MISSIASLKLWMAVLLLFSGTNAQLGPTRSPGFLASPSPTRRTTSAPVGSPQLLTDAPVAVTTAPVASPVTSEPVATDAPIVSATPGPVTSFPVTEAPVVTATDAPVIAATDAPVTVTSTPVTLAPVADPTGAPVTAQPASSAPVSPSPTTLEPTTAKPTTKEPTTSAPVTDDPTSQPTIPETDSPTVTRTARPSQENPSPSTRPSSAPSKKPSETVTPAPLTGLKITLTGMSTLNDASIKVWEEATQVFFEEFYSNQANAKAVGAFNVDTTITLSDQVASSSRRLLSIVQRDLQSSNGVTLTYTQDLTYSPGNSQVTPSDIAAAPLSTSGGRTLYVVALRNTGNSAFSGVTQVSEVQVPASSNSSTGLSTAAIIGISVGSVCALIFIICGVNQIVKRREARMAGYFGGVGDTPPTSIKAGQDDVSTLGDPSRRNLMGPESLAGYGDQSVATVDYDYSKAYGGGADHSVSSAGGTFGSNPNALGANQGVLAAGGVAALGSYSDDGSYGAGAPNVREELIDVYAPAGKLGVVIDTPDDGAPVVHAIKDSSVIADKLLVGDKLVAVDDEDVRTMTAIKVSKLISRKSGNPTRKLSIIRTTVID